MTFFEIDKSSVELLDALNKGFKDAWNKDMFISGFDGGRLTVIGIAEGEAPLGYIAYSVAGEDADIETVLILSQYRRKGYATALMDKAESKLVSLGVNKVFLEVRSSNISAIALYEKKGYKKISVRKKYYADGEDALVMVKELI